MHAGTPSERVSATQTCIVHTRRAGALASDLQQLLPSSPRHLLTTDTTRKIRGAEGRYRKEAP